MPRANAVPGSLAVETAPGPDIAFACAACAQPSASGSAPDRGSDRSSSAAPGLTYYLPRPVKPHSSLRVPGAHTLYVGPLSCTRRHDMHARRCGDRGHVSFLYITQADVISGCYEDLIVESIGKLIAVLDPAPHIFQIAVFCIDDFLGTDEDALLARLRTTYPDLRFAVDRIDPISLGEKSSMGTRKHLNLYSFIEPVDTVPRDAGANFVGNYASLDPACDFLAHLKACGAGPVREIFRCADFDAYRAMGKSRLNVVMRHMALGAARDMEDRLGIPYYVFCPSINASRVARGYGDIAELLGCDRGSYEGQVEAVRSHAARVAQVLDGVPVAVDSMATFTPFAAARALIDYGFDVRWVFRSNHPFKLDAEDEAFIRDRCPQVAVLRASEHVHLAGRRIPDAAGAAAGAAYPGLAESDAVDGAPSQGASRETRCLAIGMEGARVLRARYAVDMWHDEGYFGFHGIHRLLDEMERAMAAPRDWSDIPDLEADPRKTAGSREADARSFPAHRDAE